MARFNDYKKEETYKMDIENEGQSFLSNNEIVDLVSDYLQENIYNYAIMIDGSWGCGKTYFINNKLIPELKNTIKKRAIYISLYGVQNSEEISSLLFIAIAEDRLGKKEKIFNLANGGLKLLAEAIGNKIGSETLGNADFKNIFSPFINYDNYYFIIDDLERCAMSINDALGYINYFVEQNNSKVIIIANQKEIGSAERQNNLELKYMLASRQEITWPVNEHKFNFNFLQNDENTIVDLPELKRRSTYLFNENELYQHIKEKVIGKTIYYKPDIYDIVPLVFKKCLDDATFKKTTSFHEVVADIMISEDHYNIRTLQFSLLFFSKITKLIDKNMSDSDILIETLEKILVAIVKVSINCKNGLPAHNWLDNSEYGSINLSGDSWDYNNYIYSFKFIHDYIYNSGYNSSHIISVLSNYITEQQSPKNVSDDPMNQLRNYWEMDDSIIEQQIKLMYENLKNGKYEGNSFRWIISVLYAIKGVGLEPVPINDFIQIIETEISKGKSIFTELSPAINEDSKCIAEYYQCMRRLQNIEESAKKTKSIKDINSIFEMRDGWGNAFCTYYHENQPDILSAKEFFKRVNIELCIQRIMDSTAKEVSDFRRGLAGIYNFSNLKDCFYADGENFYIFMETLQYKQFDGKVKKFNIELLIKNIKDILQLLQYDVNTKENKNQYQISK